jgi:hypothetical protein
MWPCSSCHVADWSSETCLRFSFAFVVGLAGLQTEYSFVTTLCSWRSSSLCYVYCLWSQLPLVMKSHHTFCAHLWKFHGEFHFCFCTKPTQHFPFKEFKFCSVEKTGSNPSESKGFFPLTCLSGPGLLNYLRSWNVNFTEIHKHRLNS